MFRWNKRGILAGVVTSCYDGSAEEGRWQKPDVQFFKILRTICQWSLCSVISQSKMCHRSVFFQYCISQQNWGCGREGEGLPPCDTSRSAPWNHRSKTSWAATGASIPLQGRSSNQKPCPQLCRVWRDTEERNGETWPVTHPGVCLLHHTQPICVRLQLWYQRSPPHLNSEVGLLAPIDVFLHQHPLSS